MFDIPSSFPTDRSKAVPLRQVFVRRCFHMWHLVCPYLFIVSLSFGPLGGLWHFLGIFTFNFCFSC